ncbi:hypothetical protein BLX24_19455 [Arsenicibacter rosenii]|uniref:Uncharacterized protein n=1 Tax=Arsenicibacter rosenii TaxID=1750698 RepID=A0A1S2VFC4_9BACT|nr:hypothetical protein BLX24_19455 [Arsenicibacter rosenii]
MVKKSSLEQVIFSLTIFFTSSIVYFFAYNAVDCTGGKDNYTEVSIIDKQCQDIWPNDTLSLEKRLPAGHGPTRQVIQPYFHAAKYLLHIRDASGYRIAYVDENQFRHYRIGDRAKLRSRIGKSGCKCSETVL